MLRRRISLLPIVAIISAAVLALSACSSDTAAPAQSESSNGSTSSQSAGASSSDTDSSGVDWTKKMASRKPYANPTKVTLTVGDKVIPATLNDSVSARDLISRLPYTITLQRYSHDYCASMEDPLKYDPKDVHAGWLDGDIDFALTANYFTILFEDEEKSSQFDDQINIGRIEGPLSQIRDLPQSIKLTVALDQ